MGVDGVTALLLIVLAWTPGDTIAAEPPGAVLSYVAPLYKAACDSLPAGTITHADDLEAVFEFRGRTNLWETLLACIEKSHSPYRQSGQASETDCFQSWWPEIKREADYRWTRRKDAAPGVADSCAVPSSGHYGLRPAYAEGWMCVRGQYYSCPTGVGIP